MGKQQKKVKDLRVVKNATRFNQAKEIAKLNKIDLETKHKDGNVLRGLVVVKNFDDTDRQECIAFISNPKNLPVDEFNNVCLKIGNEIAKLNNIDFYNVSTHSLDFTMKPNADNLLFTKECLTDKG